MRHLCWRWPSGFITAASSSLLLRFITAYPLLLCLRRRCSWISNGPDAEIMTVFAKTEGVDKKTGEKKDVMIAFIVERVS